MVIKKYNKPDLHKPRYRRDALGMLNQVFYDKYRKKYPNTILTDKQIKQIINLFNSKCSNEIVSTRDGLDLPKQLGYLFIGACKIKEKPVDVPKSLELEQEVHAQNWETNQWICKVCYTNYASKYRFRNAACWGFEPSKELSNAASKAFKANHKLYVITDNFRKFNRLFKRVNHKFWENNREIVHQNLEEQRNELKNKEED